MDSTIGAAGYFGTRIVVDHDSSSVTDVFDANQGTSLRKSIMIAAKTQASTGKVFIQQVQVS